jgi:hypothetical protein
MEECTKNKVHVVFWFLLILIIFLVIFIRAPEVLLLPTLRVEDGKCVFAHFYQQRDFAQIFRFKGGYIPLISNSIGYLSVRLPTTLIPYGLTWIPLLITLVAYSIFFHERYSGLVDSRFTRGAICILFALAPLGQFHLLSHTDYSIWNTFLILILLSICPLPKNYKLLYWFVCNILIWAHPLSILILPFPLFYMLKGKKDRIFYASIILNLFVHQVLGVKYELIFAGQDSTSSIVKLMNSVWFNLKYVNKITFRASFGPSIFEWANEHAKFLLGLWAISLIAYIAFVFKRIPKVRNVLIFLGYFIFVISFFNIASRGIGIILDINNSPRYVYIQTLFFLVILVVLISQTAVMMFEKLKMDTKWPINRQKSAKYFIQIILIIYFFIMNLGNSKAYHDPYPENGRIVKTFFKELAAMERARRSHRGIYLVARKKEDWPIIIDTRRDDNLQ